MTDTDYFGCIHCQNMPPREEAAESHCEYCKDVVCDECLQQGKGCKGCLDQMEDDEVITHEPQFSQTAE